MFLEYQKARSSEECYEESRNTFEIEGSAWFFLYEARGTVVMKWHLQCTSEIAAYGNEHTGSLLKETAMVVVLLVIELWLHILPSISKEVISNYLKM